MPANPSIGGDHHQKRKGPTSSFPVFPSWAHLASTPNTHRASSTHEPLPAAAAPSFLSPTGNVGRGFSLSAYPYLWLLATLP